MFGVVSSPADTQGVFSLLALLTDPDAVRARLEELTKAQQDIAASNTAAQELAAKLAAAKQAHDDAFEALRQARIAHANQEKALLVREQQLADEKNLLQRHSDEFSVAMVKQADELETQTQQLRTLQAAVAARETKVAARETDVHKREQYVANKMGKIRALQIEG